MKGAIQGVHKGKLQLAIRETIQEANQEAPQSLLPGPLGGALK